MPQKRTRLTSCPFLWVTPPAGRLHPSGFQCSGRQSRTRAAGQKAGGVILLQRSCQSQISILPVPSTKKVLFGIVPNSTFFFGLYGGGKTAPYPPWGAPPADPNALAALASSALRSSIASFRTSSFTFISRMVLARSFSSSFMEI